MFEFLFNSPALQLIAQADIMIKIVLFALFSVSVFCVWIVLSKLFVLWKQKKTLMQLKIQVKRVRNFDELLALSKTHRDSAGGRFLLKALGELKNFITDKRKVEGLGDNEKIKLSLKDIEHLNVLLDQILDQVLSEEERYLPVLSTSAAVAPLVGLFGTVWGLVHAFVDISKNRSADIAVVAPGIAEALTTTLAGLIVAIPALVFYHYFSNELRKLEQQLWGMSDKFLSIVKRTFLG